MYDDFDRDQLLAEILRYREMAAKNGTTCFRYSIALKLARQFGMHSRAFDGQPSLMLADWVDVGMPAGVPWPSSPFAQDWLRSQGYSDCDGKIGMRATMTLIDIDKPTH
ncbi:MAG: hypothetical protein ACKVP7_28470 [Hyphomicrobiaceae bacterium]